MWLLNWFLEPLSYPFIQCAVLVTLITGITCALLSCFLILKGWSLMGDAMAHAILPGVAVASIIGMPIAIGAFGSGLCCALLTGFFKNNCRLKEDTVMGVVFSGMFALGVILVAIVDNAPHLTHLLLGNILGITQTHLITIIVVAVPVFLLLLCKRKDLALYCFDPLQAAVTGLPVNKIYYGLLCCISIMVVAMLQISGIILAIGMLIIPGMVAFMIARSFDQMLCISMLTSIISCFFGIIISYHIDGASGPLIIVIESLILICVVIFKKYKQYLLQRN